MKNTKLVLNNSKPSRTNSAPKNSKPFHAVISCSTDKYFEMQNLATRLRGYGRHGSPHSSTSSYHYIPQNLGYVCKVMKVSEGSLAHVDCSIVIAALSLRYLKHSGASNEVSTMLT